MLKLALFFLIISLIAGAFGFTTAASATALVAKILFAVFLVLFLIAVIVGLLVFPSV